MLLGASARFKALAVLPFVMTIGLDALELLVAFLQAYVFAMLTCMYLNDALHPAVTDLINPNRKSSASEIGAPHGTA